MSDIGRRLRRSRPSACEREEKEYYPCSSGGIIARPTGGKNGIKKKTVLRVCTGRWQTRRICSDRGGGTTVVVVDNHRQVFSERFRAGRAAGNNKYL